MPQLLLGFHLFIALFIVVLILMQRGKGADMGAAFGSGASQTLFGSQGSASFLIKLISVLIACFFCSSLLLNYAVTKSLKEEKLANTPQILLQTSTTIPNNKSAG